MRDDERRELLVALIIGVLVVAVIVAVDLYLYL